MSGFLGFLARSDGRIRRRGGPIVWVPPLRRLIACPCPYYAETVCPEPPSLFEERGVTWITISFERGTLLPASPT